MRRCQACAEENPERARFCLACGAALEEARPPGRRERRVVSVLFCDLVGFTSRSERLDVEDVEALLHRYHGLLRHTLEVHGGTVEKFIGDAAMALFGAPTAHEDDAERAVRAGLAIQDAVAELREGGTDVHVRVGITTGEALIALGADPARGEGMASGDVVNTAARLQAAAPTDGVLVDDATHRATDRAIRYAEADPVAAKGKADPVAVWRAVETRSFMPEQVRADDLTLVGREQEAALLVAAFERSRREPSTELITIVGAPGIGKTRLVQELESHVELRPELVTWRRGRSLAYGEGVALWALGEMVKAQAGILESDPADLTAARLGEAVAALIVDERDRDWVTRHLRPLVGLVSGQAAGEDRQVESFSAWRRFFEALAEEGPSVLVFEDIHWADDALLDFIDLLADRAGAVPLLIVCTGRPEVLERRPGWGGGKINAHTINLTPLSATDTARLIAELLDQALLPADTQAALLERAEGNPLYAQEYVRMLRDRGLLVHDAGGWHITSQPDALPESIQAIIASRLDTLPAEQREFILDASVVGRTCWVGAIAAICGRPIWELGEILHALDRKQLLRRARHSTVAGEIELGFTHALTQQVAYRHIPRMERAEKHERAAEWIERLAGERDDKAELLAHHYTAAVDLRRDAGEPVETLTPALRRALVEAGRRAQAVNAHTTAVRHLAAALELTPAGDRAHARLMLEHATAAWNAGQSDAASLRAALDVQVATGDWQAAAHACFLLSNWLDFMGFGDQVDEVDAQAFAYATRNGYTPIASQIAHGQAYRLVVTGRPAEAVPFTERVLRSAEEAGDEQGRGIMLLWHGDARVTTGDLAGIDEMREAAAILSHHSSTSAATAYNNLAESLIALGEFGEAAQARRESVRWTDRFGRASQLAYSQAGQADTLYHAGDWDAALERTSWTEDTRSEHASAYAGWTRGRIHHARGEEARALENATRVLDYATRSRNDEARMYGLALNGLAGELREGSAPAGALRQLFERWHEIGGMLSLAHVIAELGPLQSQLPAIGGAATLLPAGSRWRIALTAVAEERYADAAIAYARMGSRPLEASAHLLAAQHSAGAERIEHARQALVFYRAVAATRGVVELERMTRTIA